MNNIEKPDGVKDKIAFQENFRFSFALQESFKPGYLDEKLIQCFASRNVPIFWGDDTVSEQFNEKAIINAHAYDTEEELIREIIRIDNDKEAYLKMLSEPAMLNPGYIKEAYEALESFLINIIEQPIEKARRVYDSVWIRRDRSLYLNSNK